jgi:multiple sugar transport system ATP-binding protein
VANVTVRQIDKRYSGAETLAVDGADLEILEGEFLVIVGPSGSGKTTLMRIVAGLEEASDGEILIGDEPVTFVRPRDRNIAMVFQDYALYANMSVRDNLAFGLRMRKEPKDEIERRVEQVAELLGIEDLLPRRPRQLSGGERQRVALGRAIVRRPRLFLMDEPLSNLDALLRVQMRTELLKLHEVLGTTIIYVTHDQVEAMTMGSRIVVMRDGRIQQVGEPQSVYDQPTNRFVASFFGSPPMNFCDGTLELTGDRTRFRSTDFAVDLAAGDALAWRGDQPADGTAVVLGFRPEDATLEPASADAMVSGEVEVVEPLGSETIAYVNPGSGPLAVRTSVSGAPARHSTVSLRLDPRRLHLFAADEEGRALLRRT